MKQAIKLVTLKCNKQRYNLKKTVRLSDKKEMNMQPKTTQGG